LAKKGWSFKAGLGSEVSLKHFGDDYIHFSSKLCDFLSLLCFFFAKILASGKCPMDCSNTSDGKKKMGSAGFEPATSAV
jgi:hypothetical protein